MDIAILKTPIAKNILSAMAVAIFGFILLILTFIFDFILQSLILRFIKPNSDWRWFSLAMHILFVAIIAIISWLILNSKLNALCKAVYMTAPLAVTFVTLGMFLYNWPTIVYFAGSLLTIGILYYLYRAKKPWIYSYSVILISLALATLIILGIEI